MLSTFHPLDRLLSTFQMSWPVIVPHACTSFDPSCFIFSCQAADFTKDFVTFDDGVTNIKNLITVKFNRMTENIMSNKKGLWENMIVNSLIFVILSYKLTRAFIKVRKETMILHLACRAFCKCRYDKEGGAPELEC